MLIKRKDFNKSTGDYILYESKRLLNSSFYKDVYGPHMQPDAVPTAAGVISNDVANLLKSLYLILTGKTINYNSLIDIYNYIEASDTSKEINPKVWGEITSNITKWGKWHKLYGREENYYGRSLTDNVISIRDVNECEQFCDQFRKYIGVFIKWFEESN